MYQDLFLDLSLFEKPDFDVVDFISKSYSAPLDELSDYIEEIRLRLITRRNILNNDMQSQFQIIEETNKDLNRMQEQDEKSLEVKRKIEYYEKKIMTVCKSVRDLEAAEKKINDSIVNINKLQIFLHGLKNLDNEIGRHDYEKVYDLLTGIKDCSENFKSYSDIQKIRELYKKLAILKQKLSQQVVDDLLNELCHKKNTNSHVIGEERCIHACLVIDILGMNPDKVRKEFIEYKLETYTKYLFKRGTSEASLERIKRRFIWFQDLLKKNEHMFLNVFPLSWYVMQEMCVEFCICTKKEIEWQLQNENSEVYILIYALQKTMEVEKELTSQMKVYETLLHEKIKKSTREYKVFEFMTSCFDNYLDKYVQHENTVMKSIIPTQSEVINDEIMMFSSTQDIFLFIQESMKRVGTITSSRNQNTLINLCNVWYNNLNEYGKILQTMTKSEVRKICVLLNSLDYCNHSIEGMYNELLQMIDDKNTISQIHAQVIDNFSQASSSISTQLVDMIYEDLNVPINNYHNYLATHPTTLNESFFPNIVKDILTNYFNSFATHLMPIIFSFVSIKIAKIIIPKLKKLVYCPKGERLNDSMINQMHIDMNSLKFIFENIRNIVKKDSDGKTIYLKTVKKEFGKIMAALRLLQLAPNEDFIVAYSMMVDKDDQSETDCGRLLELLGVPTLKRSVLMLRLGERVEARPPVAAINL